MGNCLITNLKADTQNDELEYVGAIKLKVKAGESHVPAVTMHRPLKMKILGNAGTFNNSGTDEVTLAVGDTSTRVLANLSSDAYVLLYKEASYLDNVIIANSNIVSFNTQTFYGVAPTMYLMANNASDMKMDLVDIATVFGDMSLQGCIKMTCDSPVFVGRNIYITSIDGANNAALAHVADYEHSICDEMVRNGRNSGTMHMRFAGGSKTFTYYTFTSDTTTYPRGWYVSDSEGNPV